MKKILMKILLLLLIYYFIPQNLEKISASGSFDCGWKDGKCQVANDNCIWDPPSDCQYANYYQCKATSYNRGVCESFVNQVCIPIYNPEKCAKGENPPPPPSDDCSVCQETAIGCIDICSPNVFVSQLLNLAIGIGGGIAFLLIIFGALQILTSSGNPDKIQAGKELITSAIAGLLLIIFSVFILRIIAGGVLQIPGFG